MLMKTYDHVVGMPWLDGNGLGEQPDSTLDSQSRGGIKHCAQITWQSNFEFPFLFFAYGYFA